MNKWLRRLGIGAGGLLTLVAAFVAVIWGLTERRFARTWDVKPTATLALASDSATIARGQHLVTAVAKCVDCHGADLGGQTLADDYMMGRLSAGNLTAGKGGIGAAYTDADWIRAVRHGLDRAGKAMVMMPSLEYQRLSDADLSALVSYLKSLPPVDREVPARRLMPLSRALLTFGALPPVGAEVIDHAKIANVSAPAPGVTPEYGRYLADVGGCTGCHRPSLSGGGMGPGSPPARNLTPKELGSWTEADFFRALREGKRPDGTPISEAMPWKASGKMTDDEMKAVWAYIKSVPAKEFGQP